MGIQPAMLSLREGMITPETEQGRDPGHCMFEGVFLDFLREIEKGHSDPALMEYLADYRPRFPELHCELLQLPHTATCGGAVRALRASQARQAWRVLSNTVLGNAGRSG